MSAYHWARCSVLFGVSSSEIYLLIPSSPSNVNLQAHDYPSFKKLEDCNLVLLMKYSPGLYVLYPNKFRSEHFGVSPTAVFFLGNLELQKL